MISAKEISESVTCVTETLTVVDPLPLLLVVVVTETDLTLSDEMKKTVVALKTPVSSPEATVMAVVVDVAPPVQDLTALGHLPTIPNGAAACPCEIVLVPVIVTSETCVTAIWTVVVPPCVDLLLLHHSVDPLHLRSAALVLFHLVTETLETGTTLFPLLDVVVTRVLPDRPLRI